MVALVCLKKKASENRTGKVHDQWSLQGRICVVDKELECTIGSRSWSMDADLGVR